MTGVRAGRGRSRRARLCAGGAALALAALAVMPARADKIRNGTAVFSGLDKITGRLISFKATMGETVQFGSLQVTPRACFTRPSKEAPQTDTFVEIDEVSAKHELKRIFSGWMFAASPGLHGLEHPIYDIWLTSCEQPGETIVDQPQTADADNTAPGAPALPAAGATLAPAPPPVAEAPKPKPKRVARPSPRPDPDAVAEQREEPRQRFFPTIQYPSETPEFDRQDKKGGR